jgi:hypothetical protein
MGITINFSLEPKRKLFARSNWNLEKAAYLIKGLAEENGYHYSASHDPLIINICLEGSMWFRWKRRKFYGMSKTNIAGPGFHVAVIQFLEKLAERGDLKLRVLDRTGYYRKRDFLAMRQMSFYKWFKELMNMVSGWDGKKDYLFCWFPLLYIPENQKDKLISYIRPYTLREIRGLVNSGLTMAFAKDFFIWNEIEKDAYFYRNSGLALLNQHCFFMPSARSNDDKYINDSVIEYLEKALKANPKIPFPQKEYLEVCALAGHEPADISQTEVMPGDIEIGCRKHMVFRRLGNMIFGLPGHYLHEDNRTDVLDHYYDGADYGAHDYYVYAIALEGRTAEFKDAWFQNGEHAEVHRFSLGKAEAKAVVYKPWEQDGELLYGLSAQVIYGEQRMNINITCKKPGEEDWALGLIKNIRILE